VRIPSPTTADLRALFFADSLRGWIGGEGGALYRTTDGGATWSAQPSGVTGTVVDIFLLNGLKGWALAHDVIGPSVSTILLRTGDGGETWDAEPYPTPEVILNSMVFHTPDTGWAAGEFGTVVGTNDGGRSWADAPIDSAVHLRWDLRRIRFFSRWFGLAVGGRFDFTGVVWRTTDGGLLWTNDVAGSEPVNDVHWVDSLNIIGIGGDTDFGSGMIRSTDAGVTWEYTYLGIWGDARALGFRTPAEGWAPLGFAAAVMTTSDTGRTWSSFDPPDTSALYEVQFTDSTHGYMVGNGGRIFRYKPVVSRVKTEEPLPEAVRLLPAYPNPFNPTTTVVVETDRGATVTLELHDLLGRRVAILMHGMVGPGQHRVAVSGSGLAAGVYICRLFAGSARAPVASQKLLLLK
jgi:photosystem II stability/assembly factor-like uncharacterized protein